MKTILMTIWLLQATLGMPLQEKTTLMILPFEATSAKQEYRSLENGLPDILTACLSAHSDTIHIVDRSHLNAMAKELGLAYEASVSPGSAAEIGRLVSARFVITGSFWVEKETAEVQVFIYETETTRLIGTTEFRAPLNSLASGCGPFAKNISAQFRKNQNSPFLNSLPDKNPEMNQVMLQGLGFYYNGEFWKAFPAFLKVLEVDPNNANARFWLGKSYKSAGMNDLAEVSLQEFIRKFPKHSKWGEAQKLLKRTSHAN